MYPLIDDAYAQTGMTGSAGMELLIMVGIFFLIMYFMIIRPQNKRSREHRQLLASLSRGDEIVTSGGLFGKISQVEESFVRLEVQKGIEVKVQKQAINSVMPKGTFGDDAGKEPAATRRPPKPPARPPPKAPPQKTGANGAADNAGPQASGHPCRTATRFGNTCCSSRR